MTITPSPFTTRCANTNYEIVYSASSRLHMSDS